MDMLERLAPSISSVARLIAGAVRVVVAFMPAP